jgi:hypothetical protein
VSQGSQQLAVILALKGQLATSGPKQLAAISAQIATAVASAATTARQAEQASAAGDNSVSMSLTAARQTAREAVNEVMRGMKDFDSSLEFANGQDAADYHRREEARRAYIEAEQAKHTPQGDLNASGGAVGQMADAAAHGAAESPEFQRRWDKLVASTDALRTQLVRDGGDVSQFDAHLREDLRAIMRAKGVPDAKIDAMLAAHPDNPLEAVNAFVAEQKGIISEKEIADLASRAGDYRASAEEKMAVVQTPNPMPSTPIPASALDAMADLKAMGVVASDHDASQPPVHGVNAPVPGASQQATAVRSTGA